MFAVGAWDGDLTRLSMVMCVPWGEEQTQLGWKGGICIFYVCSEPVRQDRSSAVESDANGNFANSSAALRDRPKLLVQFQASGLCLCFSSFYNLQSQRVPNARCPQPKTLNSESPQAAMRETFGYEALTETDSHFSEWDFCQRAAFGCGVGSAALCVSRLQLLLRYVLVSSCFGTKQ